MKSAKHGEHGAMRGPYVRLLAMTVLSFVAMYGFMYAMVDRWNNVIPNINQFYMAGLMAAPMVIIELALMRHMYPDARRNALLMAVAGLALALFWFATRQQFAVGDEQFLKSMVPHHAGAILMCKQAKLKDPDLKKLCQEIMASQQREINFMQAKL